MSKYTAERVLEYVEKAERGYFNPVHMEMLRDYAVLLRERESAKARVPEGWTDKHSQVQRFAIQRFVAQAYDLASVAAQDLKERYFKSGATAKFLADAETAEECLRMLAAAPKPETEE